MCYTLGMIGESELQEIADYICTIEKCTIPTIRIKDVQRGRSGVKGITIPRWATNKSIEYTYYYTIHEVIHWIGYRGHGHLFKQNEKRWLSYFGLQPVYNKVYAKALLSTTNGQQLWTKKS